MTDRQLLEQLAEILEKLRQLALVDGKVKTLNGVRVPKWRVIADLCQAARQRVLVHLGRDQ